jgi:integrase
LQFLDPINKLPADAEPAKRALKGGKLARKKHFQHGSLFKRGKKNKVWVARFREPESINGQTQFVRRSDVIGTVAELPTRRDAELILSNRLRHLNSANYHPRACCYLRDFVEEWKPQVLPTLKYSTQKHYQCVLETHLLPAFGDLRLRLISREAVQNLLLLKLKQQLSWKTVKHIRTVLGTILGTAEAWGYIEDNPVRKTKLPRRGPRPERKVLAPEQLRLLLAALPEPSCSLVWLIILTGLRIGELLALRWNDVDLENGVLCVRQTLYEGHFDDPKTRKSRRTVPLSPKASEILTGLKARVLDSDGLVFGTEQETPFCRRNLTNRQLVPVGKKLGFGRIGWHSLRHANATLLDSVHTPLGTVQALLGHSSSDTRNVYLHSLPAGAREAVEKVEGLLIGPKRTQIAEIRNLGSSLIQ